MNAAFSKARLLYAALGIAILLLAGCAAPPPPPAKAAATPVYPPPPEPPRIFWERTLYSSADVVEETKEASFRRAVTGEVRTGEGLDKPYGVAVKNGRVYVGDTSARHVAVFDLNTNNFSRIGANEPGALRMPFGIDVDERGNIYVLDGLLKRVHVYDADGKFLRMFGEDLKLKRPAGLALDLRRRRAYLVDAGGVDSAEHRVRVTDLDTGKHLFDIGKRGSEPGEFNLPRDAVVGPDGTLYVVDGGNFRVQVFDPDGKYVKSFGAIGRQTGQFARPKEIAADIAGNVYVADAAFGNFQIFDKSGTLLLDVGERGADDGPGKFMLPSGIAVDDDGRIYMIDQFFRKVEVFRPAAVRAGAPYGVPAGAPKATR